MTWFKIDDKLFESTKIRAAGLFGVALWTAAGVKCASKNTDGVVDPIVAKDAAYVAGLMDESSYPRWERIAELLVRVGLWHDSKTMRRCDKCMEATQGGKLLPAGSFYFHDWNDWQLSKASQINDEAKRKEARKRRLHRNKALIDAIRERDGTLCRYCAKRVDFDDHRSDDGGTYDHVNPDGENILENVVVACRGCNIAKGDRTPTEAGMELLEPGTFRLLVPVVSNPDSNHSNPGLETDPTPVGNGPNPRLETDPTRIGNDAHAGVRTGLERFESGLEPGSENGLGRVGSGEAGAGGVEPGPGLADFPTETRITGESA